MISEAEDSRWARFFILLLFITAIFAVGLIKYQSHQIAKGEAISRFMKSAHGIDIAPEDARYFNVVLTGVDVKFENVDIFPALPRRK